MKKIITFLFPLAFIPLCNALSQSSSLSISNPHNHSNHDIKMHDFSYTKEQQLTHNNNNNTYDFSWDKEEESDNFSNAPAAKRRKLNNGKSMGLVEEGLSKQIEILSDSDETEEDVNMYDSHTTEPNNNKEYFPLSTHNNNTNRQVQMLFKEKKAIVDKPFPCTEKGCKKSYAKKAWRVQHWKEKHPKTYQEYRNRPKPKKTFPCQNCNGGL